MSHGKVDIAHLDQLRVQLDNIENVLASKGIRTKTLLDPLQDFDVGRVGLVEDVVQRAVFATETVQEVLGKDPTNVTVDGFLDRENASLEVLLKGSGRQAVNQGGFLHHLENRAFNRRRLAVGHLVQVQRDDGRSIGELLYNRVTRLS